MAWPDRGETLALTATLATAASTTPGDAPPAGVRDTGTFVFSNSYFHFTGDVVAGQPTGDGTLVLGDGSSIDGTFVRGEVHGAGVRRWASGAVYIGDFSRGEMHGVGRFINVDGTEYEGEFQFGVRCGHGRLVDRVRGLEYVGEFVRTFHGAGTLRPYVPLRAGDGSSSGATSQRHPVIMGDFKDGVPRGCARIEYPNGDAYEGQVDVLPQCEAGGGVFVAVTAPSAVTQLGGGGGVGITYSGPMQRGVRTALPSALRVVGATVGRNTSVLGQLSAGDRFATIPQHATLTLEIELTHLSVSVERVEVKPVTKGSKRPPTFRNVETVIVSPFLLESGRQVVCCAHQLPQGAPCPTEPDAVAAVLGDCPRIPLAAPTVSSRQVQQLARRPSVCLTPPPPPSAASAAAAPPAPGKGKKPAAKPGRATRGAAPPPSAPTGKLPDLARDAQLLRKQKFISQFEHQEEITAVFVDGRVTISVLALSLDPGDVVLHIKAAAETPLEPGNAQNVARVTGLECFVPLHLVRQC